MNIAQILKTKPGGVSTARQEDTVHEVATRLAQRKIGAVVIVGEGGKITGILSERDIIRLIGAHGANALSMAAGEGMTREVKTCTRNCTVEQVMEVMTKGRFRHLPVVEDGALVGIVSIGDVVKHHTAEVELEVNAMRGYLATG